MGDFSCASTLLAGAAKRFVHRLVAIGENRFRLLMVEVQEERDRILDMIFLAVAIGTLALLGGIAWTTALVVFLWQYSHVAILLLAGAIYLIAALVLCLKLVAVRRRQQVMSATLEQLRKDQSCLRGNSTN